MEAMSDLIKGGSRVPLAQLPAGTANLLARALGIPTDQGEALEPVFGGKPVWLDVGYLPREDRYFALMVGAGYDARLSGDASRELRGSTSRRASAGVSGHDDLPFRAAKRTRSTREGAALHDQPRGGASL